MKRRRVFRTFVLVSIVFLTKAIAHPDDAAGAVIGASASGYVIDSLPTDGTFDTTNSPGATSIEVYRSSFSGLARGIIEFDIQGLGAFSSAELNLFPFGTNLSGNGGAPVQVDLYVYEGDGAVSPSDASVSGESLVSTFSVSAGANPDVTIDVTSHIDALISGLATHAGFRVQLNDESLPAPIVLSMGSRNTASSFHPTLSVTHPIPEPSSLLTFAGLGLCAGIGVWRRRRKQAA